MTDPIETLAKRVLDECVEVLVDGCGAVTGVLTPVDIATALIRAAIEAERAAAVAPFRELLERYTRLAAEDHHEAEHAGSVLNEPRLQNEFRRRAEERAMFASELRSSLISAERARGTA